MYVPDHFKLTDPAEIADLVSHAPLATLISHTDTGLRADHIPLLMAKDRLIGHIAAANDLHQVLTADHPVLAVFRADDSYISANWYPSKAETHEVVPTWNYEVVHVHGRIAFHHDPQVKRGAVGQLTKQMERGLNGDQAWRMADAPDAYINANLAEIVSFEIHIDRIEAKSKLSQNKPVGDILGVTDGLERVGKTHMAAKMRRHK